MKTLYLECSSGISGDMTVAALLDLGANPEKLAVALSPLRHEGLDWTISRKSSRGIEGCDFDVALSPHGHHGHGHGHGHHGHGHAHHAHGHAGAHEHRNLHDIEHIIGHARMSEGARQIAIKTFRIVAEAEAKAHGKPLDEVHFHEVGALDSIADIVGAAVLFDDLGIGECVVTGISEGTGTVHCQHGELPVPVPAVVNIASAHSIPLRITNEVKGEMCTPTGIALAAALRTNTALPPEFTIVKTGIGLGKKDFGRPNILRAMLLESVEKPAIGNQQSAMHLLETNIDDSTGEQLGLAMEKILEAGAADVHFVPCFMKKGRPAYLLRALVAESSLRPVEEAIFKHTTTIGIRRHTVDRTVMKRETVEAELPFGKVSVKKCTYGDNVFHYPEYESVKAVAAANGMTFKDVFDAAQKAFIKSAIKLRRHDISTDEEATPQ